MIRSIANTYRSSFSGLSKETWLLSVVILINRCGYMAIPFMSMYITQGMHRSLEDAGLIVTLFGVGSVLGTTAGGYLSDKIGFRSVQIMAALASGLAFFVFGQITNFSVLCILIVLLGFIVEAFRPANLTAVASYATPDNLTRSYSLNRLAINIGWGVGSALGGFLASINYHLLFRVEGAVNIFVGILIIILLPARKVPVKEKDNSQNNESIQSPWKDRAAVRFLLLSTLWTICFVLLFRLVPVYWKEEKHIGESVIGIALGLNGVIIAVFEMILVKALEKRSAPLTYISAGIAATAIGYCFLLLPAAASFAMPLLVVLAITIGEMLAMPFMNSIFMKRSNEYNRGKYSAAYTLSWSVANIVGPMGGALIAQRFGYLYLWLLMVVVCLLCAYLFKVFAAREVI
ncbi:MFS transporter [Danxiaibacter flavus]|uniref:MFS transporter n=2 Tax=Danxiaibacter flavus TaxID=3049108 RepID=A0ABV3ZHX3_9BACT